MILYGFGPKLGLPDPSPFVLKTHTFLRMSEIEYETLNDFGNLQKAPKGKLPFIKDGDKTIADSAFIIEYLNQKHAIDLDSHLSKEQIAQAFFIRKTLEESFYWCIVYFRWIHEESWQQIKELFFGKMPFPLKAIVPPIARKGVKKSIHGHGLGRHSENEILSIAKQHLDHLDYLLGDKNYYFGDQPSSIDATIYAFLAEAIMFKLDSPLSLMARKYGNLAQYCERVHLRYYSDL